MSRDCADIIISVRGRFSEGMLKGTKRVELRRRVPRIDGTARMWVYTKTPVAAVTLVTTLLAVEVLHPDELWRKYKNVLDLERSEYVTYVSGRDAVAALKLGEVRQLKPVTLASLRAVEPMFHPPQFYARLAPSGAVLRKLEKGLKP